MYAATLNILQQFLGLWAEVIPQKLFVCKNLKTTNINFSLLPTLSILASSTRGQKFLPQHTQFALVQHRMVPKYEENNMNYQFLYLKMSFLIISLWINNSYIIKVVWKMHKH